MKVTTILFASRPKGIPTEDTFRFEETDLNPLKEEEVLLEPLFYSVDPYMRGRMSEAKSYIPPFQVGEPMEGGVVGKIIESRSEKFTPGDVVSGMLPWRTTILAEAAKVRKIDTSIAPASYYLGILGMPGLTAYFGLLEIGKPKAGETVVVSGAAGAVGMVVGQIAKIKGCHVVGIAGSDEKVSLLKEQFGFDEVINYKTTSNMVAAIKAACPNGVDVYFDNVGGEITDAVITQVNFFARIALCGQIALYNDTYLSQGPRFLPRILTRSVLIQGFIVNNYKEHFAEAIPQLAQWVKEGKLQSKETIIDGFEMLPEAFLGLFSGKNQGKMLVKR